MPLCKYRTRRRLTHAIWQVSQGMSITDAALRWGFDSHSGFYRAFQKKYGLSPTVWLQRYRVQRPVRPLLKEEEYRMMTRERFKEALTHWGLDLPLPDGSQALPLYGMYITLCRRVLGQPLHAADLLRWLAEHLPQM